MTVNSLGDMSDDLLQASFEDLVEYGPCGYLLTREDGTILRVNQTLLGWLVCNRNDLKARRFQDLVTVAGKIFYENQYFPLLRLHGSVREVAFDLIRRDLEPLSVLVNSTMRPGTDDHPNLIVTAIFDASDRRSYERELLQSRRNAEQLATIVRLSSDAIARIGPDGNIETWNESAARIFGRDEHDIAGINLRSILSPVDGGWEWTDILTGLQAGRAIQLDMVGHNMRSEHVDVSVGFTPHHDHLGAVESVSVIMRNIAGLRATQQLQQEFLAMTTHELRSPVTGIKGHAQLMKRRGVYSERSLEIIIALTQRLERLTDDLLLASQIQADRLVLDVEKIDLAALVQTAVDFTGTSDRVIRVETPAQAAIVDGDQVLLSQVVTNLLTNALKYSPKDGPVTVRVSGDEREAHISVIDQGIGISPEAIVQLFDPFYRVTGTGQKAQGMGLGLYISKRIVETHGGHISVSSEPGKGSTFVVSIPLPSL
jgi:PAS domain S-box-containing protein